MKDKLTPLKIFFIRLLPLCGREFLFQKCLIRKT